MAAKPGTSPFSDDRPTGTVRWIGQYQVIEEIGRGAGGVVYRALDPAIGREVAIKELRLSQLAPDEIPEARQRFVREAQAVGNLRHDNIVTLYQFIEEKDSLYLVMEFVPGGSLQKLIRGETPLTTEEALGIVRQVAGALDRAHGSGIVHRDIKPGNILVSNERDRNSRAVKVTDFGIARISSQNMTMTGATMGTPAYMAPEQIRASRVDARADQFSLGVVAYELLSGRLPFTASDYHGLMYQIVNAEPASLLEANPDLPPEAERVIRRALAKNPEQRFASCGVLADALEEALAPPASPTKRTIRTLRPARSVNKRFLAGVGALLLAAAALYFGWRTSDRPIVKAPAAPAVVRLEEKRPDTPRAETPPDTLPEAAAPPANSEEPAGTATVQEVLCVFPGCRGNFVVNVELATDKNKSRITAALTNRTNQAIGSAKFTVVVKRHGFLNGIPGRRSRSIEFATGPLMPGESSPSQSFPRHGTLSEKWSEPTVPTGKFKPRSVP